MESFLDEVAANAVEHVVVDCEYVNLLELLIGRGFALAPGPAAGPNRADVSLLRRGRAGAVEEFLPPIPRRGIACGEYVLTYPRLRDQAALVRADNDRAARTHALFPPMTDEDARDLIARAYLGWRTGPASTLIVRDPATGEAAGKLMVRRLVPPGVIDAGYMTFPGHRGRGVSTAGLRALTAWLFHWSAVRRIELGIKPANHASIRTAERAGFSFESRRSRRLRNQDGSFDDEISHVAVKGTWEANR